jgi:hypothetical protein
MPAVSASPSARFSRGRQRERYGSGYPHAMRGVSDIGSSAAFFRLM